MYLFVSTTCCLNIHLEPLILYHIPIYWQCIDIVRYPCIVANPLPDPSHSMFVDDRLPCILSHSTHSQFRDSRKCLSFWTYALPACVVFYFSIYYHIFVSPFNPFIPTFISSLIHFCLPKKGRLPLTLGTKVLQNMRPFNMISHLGVVGS